MSMARAEGDGQEHVMRHHMEKALFYCLPFQYKAVSMAKITVHQQSESHKEKASSWEGAVVEFSFDSDPLTFLRKESEETSKTLWLSRAKVGDKPQNDAPVPTASVKTNANNKNTTENIGKDQQTEKDSEKRSKEDSGRETEKKTKKEESKKTEHKRIDDQVKQPEKSHKGDSRKEAKDKGEGTNKKENKVGHKKDTEKENNDDSRSDIEKRHMGDDNRVVENKVVPDKKDPDKKNSNSDKKDSDKKDSDKKDSNSDKKDSDKKDSGEGEEPINVDARVVISSDETRP